jgi:drug/metabolite transporter (DMT)-like permease
VGPKNLQERIPVMMKSKARGALRQAPATHLDHRTLAAAGATVIFWGSAFAGIHAGLEAYTPAHLALLRYLVASLALACYAALTSMPLPRPRDVPGVALLGFLGIAFYNVALGYGQVTIPAGTASLLIASTPIWMALLAAAVYGERLRPWGWAGIGVSFAGVAMIGLGTRAGLGIDPRAVAVLAAALASGLYALGQKPFLARYSAPQCTAYAIWAGTLLLLPFCRGLPGELQAAPAVTTLAVGYLGVFPAALGYLTWAYVLARVPAPRAGSCLYLVPAIAMLTAWLWLGEVPPALSLVGGVLVVGGVAVVNGRRQSRPAGRPRAP